MKDLDLDDRDLARWLSTARVIVGALLFVAPRRAPRVWTGEEEDSVTSVMTVRGLGARDAAIGVGTLVALQRDGDVAGWLRAGAVADSTDTLSVITSFGRLRGFLRWGLLGSASCAAYVGWTVAGRLD